MRAKLKPPTPTRRQHERDRIRMMAQLPESNKKNVMWATWFMTRLTTPKYPDDDLGEQDEDSSDEGQTKRPGKEEKYEKQQPRKEHHQGTTENHGRGDKRGLVIGRLIKAFIRKQTCSGAYNKYLDNVLSNYLRRYRKCTHYH